MSFSAIPAPTLDLPERWRLLWLKLGLVPPADAGAALIQAWREPHRRYHTVEHLEECLKAGDDIERLSERPGEIELAIWYHNAVYDIASDSNELKSAYLAERTMTAAGCDREAIGRARSMILATRHHAQPQSTDEALLLDIDLAILGSAPARFDRYDADIREEYHAMPWSKYVAGRRQVLRGFLEKPRLYFTGHFHDQLDQPARINLSRALKRLRPTR